MDENIRQVTDKPAERGINITNLLLTVIIILGGIASTMLTKSIDNVNVNVIAVEASVNNLNIDTGKMGVKIENLDKSVEDIKVRVNKLDERVHGLEVVK